MDAIKKKMQAMKVEKDNAMDRSDVCEQASKDAKVRAGKAEEEVEELIKKSQQLEVIKLNVKCHEMLRVMKCQISQNVKIIKIKK